MLCDNSSKKTVESSGVASGRAGRAEHDQR